MTHGRRTLAGLTAITLALAAGDLHAQRWKDRAARKVMSEMAEKAMQEAIEEGIEEAVEEVAEDAVGRATTRALKGTFDPDWLGDRPDYSRVGVITGAAIGAAAGGGLDDAIDGAGIGATLGAAANVADRAHQINKAVKVIKR
ncbi:hypothetical protein TBR22_A42310 [Luteitalea sp. TBR-22]|uniref:hypothetical protein n=1 Tax=Luteitalea sp. TBR-22 TaxID=2802971 RepID=UPI001AF4B906|nr:hypothetical protein [Luteitalea sp. TBR-22]BCS35005.1 hypothetical protein TBR22_A42310 [Luteitalea sp. TBR-22]